MHMYDVKNPTLTLPINRHLVVKFDFTIGLRQADNLNHWTAPRIVTASKYLLARALSLSLTLRPPVRAQSIRLPWVG